jgi:hypothetical protein
MGMPSDLLQQLAFGSKGTDYGATHANQVKFKAPIASIVAAHMVFNGMCPQVTWDAEMQLGIDTHEGLLKQLALGRSYMDEEKTTHMVELNASEVLTHVGDEIHANLGMDGDCTSGLDTRASLLQQSAWGRVVFDYEMGKPTAEPVLEDVLANIGCSTVTIDSDMHLKDQVCKSELFVDAYLMEVKHKEAFISMSQWDPRIWHKGTAHEQQQLEIYRIIERQWDPSILKWLRNPFELQSWNGGDLNEQGMVPVNDIFNVLPAGHGLNFWHCDLGHL